MAIFFFGDSFTQGVGDDAGAGWVGRVTGGASVAHVNCGRTGDTSEDIRARFQGEISGRDVSGIVFCFGAYDCLLGENRRPRVGQLDRLKNAKALMVEAKMIAPILFLSPFPMAENDKATACVADTARQFATIARANGVPYVNIFDGINGCDVWHKEALANDGVHPGAGGYEKAAALIVNNDIWHAWVSGL